MTHRNILREFITGLVTEEINASLAVSLAKEYAPKVQKKYGIDISSAKVLATGTHGTACDIGNGMVLKVTDDKAEASTAVYMMDRAKGLPTFTQYYASWKFPENVAFGIIQEKLEPLPEAEAADFNKALVNSAIPLWMSHDRSGGKWEEVKRLAKEHVMRKLRKEFKNTDSREAQEFRKEANAAWNKITHVYRIRQMFEDLTKLGVDFNDYHAGNMMRRPSDSAIVLIDLGMSKIRGGATANVQQL